jgi:hypothetical protein
MRRRHRWSVEVVATEKPSREVDQQQSYERLFYEKSTADEKSAPISFSGPEMEA